jgi:hypothetical protein
MCMNIGEGAWNAKVNPSMIINFFNLDCLIYHIKLCFFLGGGISNGWAMEILIFHLFILLIGWVCLSVQMACKLNIIRWI